MSAGAGHVQAAEQLLAEAASPQRLDPAADVPSALRPDQLMVVTQDTTVSVTNALMAAQVQAILAVAAELAEANEIAAGSNRPGPPVTPPAPPTTPPGKGKP